MSDTSIRLTAGTKRRLELLKREGESYDDVIRRLTAGEKWGAFGIASGDPDSAREGLAGIHRSMRREMERGVEEMDRETGAGE